MVPTLTCTNHEAYVERRYPLVVELVGLPGAGKTTLSHALGQINKKITTERFPFVRQISHLPFFAKQATLLSPLLFQMFVRNNGNRLLTGRELAWMAILNGWHRQLRKKKTDSDRILLLDQGPIFLLYELYATGPSNFHGLDALRWWRKTYHAWSQTIDIIVWLDTSNTELFKRIHDRKKWHLLKEEKERVAYRWIDNCRMNYKNTINHLRCSGGRFKLIEIDTSTVTIDKLAQRLASDFGMAHSPVTATFPSQKTQL